MKQIIYILPILFFACQNPNETVVQEEYSFTQHTDSLASGQKSTAELNSELQKENEHLNELIPILDFSSASIVSDTLVQIIYSSLVEESVSTQNSTDYQFLYALSELANPNRNNVQGDFSIDNLIESPRLTTYLHYLWSKIDRSPENIKYLFDQNKGYAYALLKTGDAYQTSGLERTIKILLKSYEEIAHKEDLLTELATRSETNGVLADTIYSNIESQEMKGIITEFRDSDFVSYNHWVYSFWARRYKEKNVEMVHQIIEEFNNEMSTYKPFNLDEEEDLYEEGY